MTAARFSPAATSLTYSLSWFFRIFSPTVRMLKRVAS
jgi:hypothetical protein